MPRESAGVSADVYRRSRMQRERIIKELRERGYRITRQRQVLIDIILEMSIPAARRYTTRPCRRMRT